MLSVVLFLLGAGATDPRLQGFGALMLLAAPIARPWIADLKRARGPDQVMRRRRRRVRR